MSKNSFWLLFVLAAAAFLYMCYRMDVERQTRHPVALDAYHPIVFSDGGRTSRHGTTISTPDMRDTY